MFRKNKKIRLMRGTLACAPGVWHVGRQPSSHPSILLPPPTPMERQTVRPSEDYGWAGVAGGAGVEESGVSFEALHCLLFSGPATTTDGCSLGRRWTPRIVARVGGWFTRAPGESSPTHFVCPKSGNFSLRKSADNGGRRRAEGE